MTTSSSRRWILLAGLALAVGATGLLTSCDSTYELTGGRPPCDAALHYSINRAGFSDAQLRDIWSAAGMVGREANVSITFDGFTSESWSHEAPAPGADHVLIEHRTTSANGRNAAATATPWADDQGIYRGGSMWFGPVADGLPVNRALDSTWGSTYLKLSLHEWSHFMGLADLDRNHQESIMYAANSPGLSEGDHNGLQANGCANR